MTPEQSELIKDSWNKVEHLAVVNLFYQKLFEMEPELEDMFLNSLPVQQEKFVATLSLIIAHMDDPETLGPTVQALGVQHAGFGVTTEHYDLVRTALISALEQTLGSSFSAATEQAWTDAYNAIAEAMKMADIESIAHPV